MGDAVRPLRHFCPDGSRHIFQRLSNLMPRTHSRSSSPAEYDSAKRRKTSHSPTPTTSSFADGLFNAENIAHLNDEYKNNFPFKHAVVDHLFQNNLLENVKNECLRELDFTTKETDIYKVNQTGDLASLNYLTPDQVALLPNLLTLRDALYSIEFRRFLQSVTNCGPLSGIKQDMSVNSYTNGCHLLNHDDVIGTRRVSYILYMPLPNYQMWQQDWGGALELYPVKSNGDGQLEPEPVPSKSIPPSWNQFIFFEAQPGKSFHSVEEVVVGGENDPRERLSISGWFHAPQEGEEGYEPLHDSEVKSSREQLTSASTVFNSYKEGVEDILLPDDALPEVHVDFLSEYLNPVYLQPRTMKALAARFVEESSLELHSFLSHELSHALEMGLRNLDAKDGLGGERQKRIPPHAQGGNAMWAIKGPPHRWRYCVLKRPEKGALASIVRPLARSSVNDILRSIQDELFPSPPFRSWLTLISRLMPLRCHVEARRFRPGLDYTLATSEEKEARLDVVLGLTPEVKNDVTDKESSKHAAMHAERGWQTGEWGGWECYMAPHDEEDDPAVYRSGSTKKSGANGHSNNTPGRGPSNPGSPLDGPSRSKTTTPPTPTSDDEEDESTLLTVQPGFNRLLLVLRDEKVMHFVKYVSAAAEGSRWDICGEYEVGMVASDDED
ncbi:nuclear protein [Amanita rubescens]|nr:nuclear protein [Amanita rubescens]